MTSNVCECGHSPTFHDIYTDKCFYDFQSKKKCKCQKFKEIIIGSIAIFSLFFLAGILRNLNSMGVFG